MNFQPFLDFQLISINHINPAELFKRSDYTDKFKILEIMIFDLTGNVN